MTNWLVKNRRGAHWSNTRNTAITVLALNDYLQIIRGAGYGPGVRNFCQRAVHRDRTKVKDVLSARQRFFSGSKSSSRMERTILKSSVKMEKDLYISPCRRNFSVWKNPITPAGLRNFSAPAIFQTGGPAHFAQGSGL